MRSSVYKPDSMDGEVIQLDVLNYLVQKSVSHGVKICKGVCLETEDDSVNRKLIKLLLGAKVVIGCSVVKNWHCGFLIGCCVQLCC